MTALNNDTSFSTPINFVKPYFSTLINSDVVQKSLQIFDDVLDDNPLLNHAIAFSGGVLIGKSLGDIHSCKVSYLKQIAVTILGLAFAHLAINNTIDDIQRDDDFELITTYSTCLAGVVGGTIISSLRSPRASSSK